MEQAEEVVVVQVEKNDEERDTREQDVEKGDSYGFFVVVSVDENESTGSLTTGRTQDTVSTEGTPSTDSNAHYQPRRGAMCTMAVATLGFCLWSATSAYLLIYMIVGPSKAEMDGSEENLPWGLILLNVPTSVYVGVMFVISLRAEWASVWKHVRCSKPDKGGIKAITKNPQLVSTEISKDGKAPLHLEP